MNDKLYYLTLFPALLALGLAGGGTAFAQETAIERCAKLDSDAERLACFDAAVKDRAERATPARETSAPPVAPPPTSAASEAATPPAAGSGPTGNAQPLSKDEKKAARRAKKEQEKANREYTATVTALRKRPHGQMVVTLDNGEVWSEQYASRGFLVRVGDEVSIRKSRFSPAYRLVDKNGKGYSVTRIE